MTALPSTEALARLAKAITPGPQAAQEAVPVAWRSVERKFYRYEWPLAKVLEARKGGLVTDEGEAWSYRYTHKDGVGGEYDMLIRREPVAHPPQPSASVVEAMKHLHDIINCGNCSWSRQSARLALRALKGEDE